METTVKIDNINHLQAAVNEYENSGYQACKKGEAIRTIVFVDKLTRQQKTIHLKS